MTPKQTHRQGALGRRLMWTLLIAIAVIVVMVLFFYGIKDPEKGPGNLPPGGGGTKAPPAAAAAAATLATFPRDGAVAQSLAVPAYKKL